MGSCLLIARDLLSRDIPAGTWLAGFFCFYNPHYNPTADSHPEGDGT
jgi:hypothetical protein